MCQISSLVAAAEGPVAEFSSFANFEEKKRKSNLLMSFPKTGSQMGSFGQIRKNSFFGFCRPILDIFGLTLLIILMKSTTALNPTMLPSSPIFRCFRRLNGARWKVVPDLKAWNVGMFGF